MRTSKPLQTRPHSAFARAGGQDGHWIFLFRQLREGVRRGVSIEDALDETRDGYPSVPAADIDDVVQRAYYRPDLCRIPLTDAGNALRFAELARGLALHAPALGGWLIYEHGRWTLPSSNVVQELAKEVSADLRAEAKRFPGGTTSPGLNEVSRGQASRPCSRSLSRSSRSGRRRKHSTQIPRS